jgi:hypothetical protein
MNRQEKSMTRYEQMTTAELREATREYDRELPVGPDGLPGRPMNARERKQWSRVKRKMGRPTLGKGVKRVMISLERDLLRKSDAFAKRRHLNRSQLISASLRKLMAG